MLLAVDGYRYGDKAIDRSAARRRDPRRAAQPPGDRRACPISAPRPRPSTPSRAPIAWSALLAEPGAARLRPRPVRPPAVRAVLVGDDRACPKPIVHGHGGILLEHLKALALHTDLGPADRFCWFTTTGWMMWNYLVSGLAVGSTVVLFDGNPAWPDLVDAVAPRRRDRDDLPRRRAPRSSWPAATAGLRARAATSTWRRCAASGRRARRCRRPGFRWVARARSRARSRSARSAAARTCAPGSSGRRRWCRSGRARSAAGCSARGSRRSIPTGRSLVGEQGELVITAPMPSMPVALWGDADGSRMRAAYFEPWPGRLAPRRLAHDHRARVVRDHRPQRRDAQPRRRPPRDRRVLRGRRGAARGRRQPRRPPRGRGRRPRASCCCSSSLATARRSTTGSGATHHGRAPRRPLAAARPGRDPRGARRSRARCPARSSRCR